MDSSALSLRDAEALKDIFYSELRLAESRGLVDIAPQAFWQASSSKEGCGVDEIINDSPYTYWQSDGTMPHMLTVRFSKRVSINQVSLFASALHDESYTPSIVSLFAGTGLHDLVLCGSWNLAEPNGWSTLSVEEARSDGQLKCFMLRIVISANHQHGKDSHIRAVKLFTHRPTSDFVLR